MTKNTSETATVERRVSNEERRRRADTDVHRERRREQRRQWETRHSDPSDHAPTPEPERMSIRRVADAD
jgi:hypothetical protein